ncbi:hypothetical protein fh0823_24030 [Francisella halioticida]|uniref:hypothetical protein n=1 Tax=Francisella halioticida TaxID=549298 RepID=UPI001AF61B18|nr:hypothetical protein [Francisella halioticida]BCD92264.1 hypothetical protein fh0823_24030 [Francisella halioticida]
MIDMTDMENKLNADHKKDIESRDYLIDVINNEDYDLTCLTLFEDMGDKLLEFALIHKKLITKEGFDHILDIKDIMYPVFDDQESYEIRKRNLAREHDLDIDDFPERVEYILGLQSAEQFGIGADEHVVYSEEELLAMAKNKVKH